MIAQKEKIKPVRTSVETLDFKHQFDNVSRSGKLSAKGKKKKVGRVILLPVLLAGIAYLVNLGIEHSHASKLFLVKNIKIEGNNVIPDQEILNLANIKTGTPLYEVDLTNTEQKIHLNPYLKNVSVSRSLPASVEIQVEERKPIAFLNDGELVPVDEEGVILPYLSGGRIFDLPVLSHLSPIPKIYGRKSNNTNILNAVQWLKILREADEKTYYRISEMDFTGGKHTAYLTQGGAQIIFGETQLKRQMAFLKAAIEELESDNKIQNTRYIDLRFENQIVVKEKTPLVGG